MDVMSHCNVIYLPCYDYHFSKNRKMQKRGKLNLIGRLQLSTEHSKGEDNESIVQLRIFRVQVIIERNYKIK